MNILTSDIIRGEIRSWGSLNLQPGQVALVVRKRDYYEQALTEKKDQIIASFREFPSFRLEEGLPLIEIEYPTISRVQGVLYLPERSRSEEGLLYLNVGQALPQYKLGKRPMSREDELIFNQRLKVQQKIKISGDEDSLQFILDPLRKYILTAIRS